MSEASPSQTLNERFTAIADAISEALLGRLEEQEQRELELVERFAALEQKVAPRGGT